MKISDKARFEQGGSDGSVLTIPSFKTPKKHMERIRKEYTLNDRQLMVYKIVSQAFLKQLKHNGTDKGGLEKPLRMMMTGPGGTGKTHVIKAVDALMISYGCSYSI